MRNILVFPSGKEIDFTYPSDRIIEEGERFNVLNEDNSTHLYEVVSIERKENAIYYVLEML